MSRWGNCHDNAVANSYFQLLKRERISRKNYLTQQAARSDIFNYIAVFYNASRCHSSADGLMPAEFGKIISSGPKASRKPWATQATATYHGWGLR